MICLFKQKRFSTGPASYFYDVLDEMLAADFKSDITADFNYFNGLSKITPSSPNDPPKVNELGLTEGMKTDLWLNKNKITPADYLTIYPRMRKIMIY